MFEEVDRTLCRILRYFKRVFRVVFNIHRYVTQEEVSELYKTIEELKRKTNYLRSDMIDSKNQMKTIYESSASIHDKIQKLREGLKDLDEIEKRKRKIRKKVSHE